MSRDIQISPKDDSFVEGLKAWCDQVENNIAGIVEQGIRKVVMNRIIRFKDNPDQLVELSFANFGLTSLPNEICQLDNLVELNLEGNNISSFPSGIDGNNFNGLQVLNLSDNGLTSVPIEVTKISSLQRLDLRGNQLTVIPDAISSLSDLQTLLLTDNQLTSLPVLFSSLSKLKTLNLGSNQIESFPEEIFELRDLETLFIGRNQIESIPGSIAQLANLIYFEIPDNNLISLPDEIGQLVKLQRFNISNNSLTSLPNTMANLINLERIVLKQNQLTSLPDGLITQNNFSSINNNIFTISANDNNFSAEEISRLQGLVQDRRITLSTSVYDQTRGSLNSADVIKRDLLAKILAKSVGNQGEKQAFALFLNNDISEDFRNFIGYCYHTKFFGDNQDQMISSLYNIVNKMHNNPDLKAKCEALASTAFGTCGDRVALSFVQMQISLGQTHKNVLEMDQAELFVYAKQEAVIKFLSEKSQKRIDYIKENGGVLDEIETHLAYLQAASDLGVYIDTGMLYATLSNVDPKDLEDAKKEFNEKSVEYRIAEYLYDDDQTQSHEFVRAIVESIRNKDEFSVDESIDGEKDVTYIERLDDMKHDFREQVVSAIAEKILIFQNSLSVGDIVIELPPQSQYSSISTPGAAAYDPNQVYEDIISNHDLPSPTVRPVQHGRENLEEGEKDNSNSRSNQR